MISPLKVGTSMVGSLGSMSLATEIEVVVIGVVAGADLILAAVTSLSIVVRDLPQLSSSSWRGCSGLSSSFTHCSLMVETRALSRASAEELSVSGSSLRDSLRASRSTLKVLMEVEMAL